MVLAVIAIWWAYDTFQKGTFPWQKSTISITAQACSTSCTSNDKFAYCTEEKAIKLVKKDYESLVTDLKKIDLEKVGLVVDSDKRSITGTCKELADSRAIVNWFIDDCETIDCPSV